MSCLHDKLSYAFSLGMNIFDDKILGQLKRYNSRFLVLKSRYACPQAILHFGIGSPDVLVVRGSSSLDMGFSVRADASRAEGHIALFWVVMEVQCAQQLDINSLGCKSQNILVNSIISIRKLYIYLYLSVIIIMFDNVLEKAKLFWTKHKYKILAGVSFIAAGYFALKFMEGGQETKWSSFIQAIRQNKVKQVVVDNDVVFFRSETSEWFRSFLDTRSPGFIWSLIKDKDIIFSQKKELIPSEIYPVLLSCTIGILSFKYLMGSLNKKDYTPIDLKGSIVDYKTFFDDIYGGQEIKIVLREVIQFLKDPQFYENMGARIRRGVLFYGPPGTGKTMLARALATQAGCQFIRVTASQFQQLYVGVGPKRVRQLFKAARKFPEGCIIFIDQIDALGSRANSLRDNHQTTTTINQFLNQMDGFSQNQKIVAVAATNKIGLVDHAVLRAGRFDLKVHIPLPRQQQRKGILWKLLDKRLGYLHKVEQKAIDFIAESSQNWCGADLQCLVNQAIYRAISQNNPRVEDQHILSSFQEMLEMRQMK